MTQYALKSGNDPSATPLAASQNINFDVPTNPIFKNDLTQEVSVVCYEVRDDNSSLTGAATNGVSRSATYSTLNRIYPNSTTVADYLENKENTPGYRIKCLSNSGQSLADLVDGTIDTDNDSDGLPDTDHYFVIIHADDYKKHHFAKITKITTDDALGDSFEFEPAMTGEIAIGTKFAIHRGPPVADTAVIAVAYGLAGSGDVDDKRHDVFVNCSRPLFYFFNDRTDKDNQLDHNTKYFLLYSKFDGTDETHAITHFLTEQDFGLEVIDYGPYTISATLVDNCRVDDTPSTTDGANERYNASTRTAYTHNYTGWNTCFYNIYRTTDNKIKANTSGSFTGPTRYIHYGFSETKNNSIPRVMDIDVFQSITKTGTYADIRIADPTRIMRSKIIKFEPLIVRQQIAEGTLFSGKDANLPGQITGSSGGTVFEARDLEKNQDWRVVMKNSAGVYETFRIGDYHYQISAIAAPTYNSTNNRNEQSITINKYRKTTDFAYSSGTIQESVTNATAKRQRWSKITSTLLVDFEIDTEATHSNADSRDLAAGSLTYNGVALTALSQSRINNLDLILIGGEYSGHRLKVNYGDSVNNYIKIITSRTTMYQKESLDYPNILDYFNGSFLLEKTIFSGTVENIEEYVDDGKYIFQVSGRNDIHKLLGPIINRDYEYSKDWVYSTITPFNLATTTGRTNASAINVGDTTFNADAAGISAGDLLFENLGTNYGWVFIGRVTSASSTAPFAVVLEEGSLAYISATTTLHSIASTNHRLAFGKAIQASPSATKSPTSLRGTANKGLFFNSGLKLTKSSGKPETDGASLIGTSSYSHSKARGYYINYPRNLSGDLPFYCQLTDELSSTVKYSEVHTINSLSHFNVVSIDSKEGNSVIELAPNCPAVLGRIDLNHNDTRFKDFVATSLYVNGAKSKGDTDRVLVDGGSGSLPSVANVLVRAGRGRPLFNSSGALIGMVERIEVSDYTAATAVPTEWEILFTQPLKVALADDEQLYEGNTTNKATTGTSANHGLYLLNTQGLANGGVLHKVNSGLSSAQKPITFSYQENSTVGATTGAATGSNFQQYGMPVYRYCDLQKGGLGSIYFSLFRLATGTIKGYYTRNRGNANAYALAHKLTGAHRMMINDRDSLNTIERTKQFSHETRGILPAHGSAFGDITIYNSAAVTPELHQLAHYHNADLGDWAATTGTDRIEGYKENIITRTRDRLENVDPKMIRWFIFSPGDMWPESMRRQHHLGYSARDITNYSLVLRGAHTKENSNISHQSYSGMLAREQYTDESFEDLEIQECSINGNDIKRVGLMRLKELTFDWHFNAVDSELPPDVTEDGIGSFNYGRFLPVKETSFLSTSTEDVNIANVSEYDSAKTTITTDNDSGGQIILQTDLAIFTADGRYLGNPETGSNTTRIILGAKVKLIDGALYTGNIHIMRNVGANAWKNSVISGRGGEEGFANIYPSDKTTNAAKGLKNINLTQGAIIRGGYPNGSMTSDKWDDNFHTGSDLNASVIIMPPIFHVETTGDKAPLDTTNNYIGSTQASGHYAVHPSRVLEWLFSETYTDHEVYRGCKAVIIGRYAIELSGEWRAGIGSVVDIADTTAKLPSGSIADPTDGWAIMYADTTVKKLQPSAGATAYTSLDAAFVEFDSEGSAISATSGTDSLSDGIHFLLKPLLHVKGTGVSIARGHANFHNPGVGSEGEISTWEFDLPDGNPTTTGNYDNHWLRFCPNLTGCYLVGTEAKEYSTDTLNSASARGWEGTWTDTTAADTGKAAVVSVEGTHPHKMHYIISHTVSTSGSGQKHYITVDNANVTFSAFYRVMQPAETCLWPKSPTSIELYKMSSKYTKRPDSDEMFGNTPHIHLWQRGEVKANRDQYAFNEGVQSMYVLVDMDSDDDNAEFIVPRTYTTVFGLQKRFIPGNSYDVLLNDGVTQSKRTMNVITAETSTKDCRLKFSDSFDKMAGIVSIGEIFTVTTPTPTHIFKPTVANIASSVTICQEAEQIINDILEEHNINYTSTTLNFPYFTSPIYNGVDLYTATSLLAGYKDKKMIISNDGIKLRPDVEALDYTGIKLTSSSNDIKIIEVSRGESLFDVFNEVIVYGSSRKAIKNRKRSIAKIGKKTLEEFDESLTTQQDVDRRAQYLLMVHHENNYRIKIKVSGFGIELLQPGDIIALDFPDEGIVEGDYMVLEMRHNHYLFVELELGHYNKGLTDRIAELISQQKKTAVSVRANKFKTLSENSSFLEQFGIKELNLKIKITEVILSPFTIGFNYPVDVVVTGGTNEGAPIGFNASLGSVSKSVVLDKDLT